MEISHRASAPHTSVISIAGKVMLGTESEQIVDLVTQLLANGIRTFIFDLAGVTAIDSTGIGRFIASYDKISAAEGEIRMTGARHYIFQAFHVTRLDLVFPFYRTLEEACNAT